MISKKKLGWKLLFLVALVVWIFSFSWMDGIGLIGLVQYLAFMVSGGYVVLFLYANWDAITRERE